MTPYQFTEFWTPLLEKKQPIIHIALGSGISGTWANAVSAADMLMQDHPDADIRVIDSTLASVGYGMLAILAADLRDCGSSADECQMQLEKVKSNINTYYTTGDLTYLYRSGRVSRTGMVIAHALNIWPILNLDLDGHLIVQAKERGKKKTIERIHRIISELCVDPEDQTLYLPLGHRRGGRAVRRGYQKGIRLPRRVLHLYRNDHRLKLRAGTYGGVFRRQKKNELRGKEYER